MKTVKICINNKFAQALAKNMIFYDRSKHIKQDIISREYIIKKEWSLSMPILKIKL